MATKVKWYTVKHFDRLTHTRVLTCNVLFYRVHNVADPWQYEGEIPIKMRKVANSMNADLDGFGIHYKKRHPTFKSKVKRREFHDKNIKSLIEKNGSALRDVKLLDAVNQKRSKSNLRKVRKSKIKESNPEEITSNEATQYLELLERIRDGVRRPKSSKIKKHLENINVDKTKIKEYFAQIDELSIRSVIDIEKYSTLPSKTVVDAQHEALDTIYNQISGMDELLHLDLYTRLLLSFGAAGRTHRMMSIYKELKKHNLQITNDTLIAMLTMVEKHTQFTKQLWNEYLNDFRKGKIPQRPTLELFNALLRNYSHCGHIFETSSLFRMMVDEFKIAPDSDSMLYLLRAYKNAAPPRYKSAQKLIAKMRNEYAIEPTSAHYATVLSTISSKWNHFNWDYKQIECVDDKDLAHFKDGVDLQRCFKVFVTVLDHCASVESGLLSAILKACRNAKDTKWSSKLRIAQGLVDKYCVESERFHEISSDVASELLMICFQMKEYGKAQRYYDFFTKDERIRDRFVVDCDLFCGLIDGITCDLKGKKEYEEIAMSRIEWIESEMSAHDVVPNMNVWYSWFMMAKRLKSSHITTHFIDKMNSFHEEIKYFEFDFALLQSVVEAFYRNHAMDDALRLYSKYYVDIELFSHFDLKNTGQREIDFHGFRTGFACVALQWILQNEYPPANISKYLLQKYANKNPDVSCVVGQGHHNSRGDSRLFRAITAHIAQLTPKIELTRYENNPGQIRINGDHIVAWRKYHGYQVDVLKVNDNLQMRLFI